MDVFSFVDYNDNIYCKAYSTNPGTFILDKRNNTMTVLEENEPEFFMRGAYFRCYRDNIHILYLPYESSYFSILNVENLKTNYIEKKKAINYRNGAVYKGHFFAFPEDGELSDIAVVDVLKNEINYPFESVKGTRVTSFGECCFCNKYVYTCINKSDTIARLDLENYSIEEIQLNKWGLKYKTIAYSDGHLFLSGEFDALVRVDKEFNSERIVLLDEYLDKNNNILQSPRFSDSRKIGNYIYYSPLKYRCVIRYNTYRKEIEYLMPVEGKCISWGVTNYNNCAYIVLIQEVDTLGHLLIHPNGVIEENNLFKLDNCKNLFYTLNAIYKESAGLTLGSFINVIKVRE